MGKKVFVMSMFASEKDLWKAKAEYYEERYRTLTIDPVGGAKPACSDGLSDTELLDFLEDQNGKSRYTGKCVFRLSTSGRGWRLHETSGAGALGSVRGAIKSAIEGSQRHAPEN